MYVSGISRYEFPPSFGHFPGMVYHAMQEKPNIWHSFLCDQAGFGDVKSLTQDLAATHQKIQDLGFHSVQLNKLAETSMGCKWYRLEWW